MPVDLEHLRSLDALNDLPADQLSDLAAATVVTEYRQGETIFRIGEHDSRHCYLFWGQVKLQSDDGKVTLVGHDDASARFPLARLQPRRFIGTAAVDGTRIAWLDSDSLEECLSTFRDSLLVDGGILITA